MHHHVCVRWSLSLNCRFGTERYAVCELPKKSKGINGVLPSEARRADSGGGVLGEEAACPLPPVNEVGEPVVQRMGSRSSRT